ncbi:unnamed protein product, partial [Ranitomeya imitator]
MAGHTFKYTFPLASFPTNFSPFRKSELLIKRRVKFEGKQEEHPGVCPTGLQDLSCSYLNKTLCSRDSDCLPEQKCCLSHGNILQCTAVKNEKPGSCPITRARCLLPFVKPLCNSDRDCLGQQKCCTPLCLRQCTDPVPS